MLTQRAVVLRRHLMVAVGLLIFGPLSLLASIAYLWPALSYPSIPSIHTSTTQGELPRISKLHYLVPSSIVTDAVCAGVISALVNHYPIPELIGFKGEGEYDAQDHLAKLRILNRWFQNTNATDDDLVIVVDSLDVIAQLPASVMIERYFDMAAQSEQRLADQRGVTIDGLHDLGIRQTIMYGAGKMCFPATPNEPVCDLMPPSNVPRYRFGKNYGSSTDDTRFVDSRFLNSGTIMGPVGDLRAFIARVLTFFIEQTAGLSPDEMTNHMDQWYTASIYARQEYYRAIDMNGGTYPGNLSHVARLPGPRRGPDDVTEFHVFLDFESQFTQTQCRNELEIHGLRYNNHDLTASVARDHLHDGEAFRPYAVQMPANIYRALGSVWDRLSKLTSVELPRSQRQWIQSLTLGTNVATERIFAFYHNTCNKDHFLERYAESWFYPFIVPLLREARKDMQEARPINPEVVDGRMWEAAARYPDISGDADDGLGGVFTDHESVPFIALEALCKTNWTMLVGLGHEP